MPTPAAPPPDLKAKVEEGPRLPVETMVVAAPIAPLAQPVFPAAALGREKMPVTVGVRIMVDATGRVTDMRLSLAVISTPTPYQEEFRRAVEEALAQWRFRPAELCRLKPMLDATGAPAWALDRREKTECGFDVSFTFQSTGEVTSRVK